MKILFTIGTLGGGGAERNVVILANELAERGYEVGVLCIWGDEIAYELDSRVECIILDVCKIRVVKVLQRIYKIREAIKDFAPDVIVSFLADVNSCVLLMTRGIKCKVIVSERNDPHIDPTIRFYRFLRKIMYPFADGYVFQTLDAKKYFKNILKNKFSIVIPNPVRPNMPIHQDNESKVIVTACRLVEQKNLQMLINAFVKVIKKIPDSKLHIYGEGILKEELERIIEKKGLNNKVLLLGFVPNVCDKINEAEIFVLSSNYEGMSNSMLEALAMGMPTVVTDCPIGGARMVIKDGINGRLVPVKDDSAMAEAIIYLLNNKYERCNMSYNARKICDDNSIEKTVDVWQKFIEEVWRENEKSDK